MKWLITIIVLLIFSILIGVHVFFISTKSTFFWEHKYGLYGCYGQYTIAPYTNKAWWGYYGGTNRGWCIFWNQDAHRPVLGWHKDYLNSNGNWELNVK